MTYKEEKLIKNGSLPLFNCTKCGSCCREESMLITVTGSDIARISRILGLTPETALRALDFYVLDGSDKIPIGLQDIPSPKTERGFCILALKKMENGDCIFLKDNLCMIHMIRPVVCQSFPFVFRKTGKDEYWGLSAAKHICPGLGVGPAVSDDELQELSKTVFESLRKYRQFVEEWNQRPSHTVLGLIEAILSAPLFLN